MDERRSAKRWHTVLEAKITSDGRPGSLECVVRELSDTGARIYFADLSELPPVFELEIPRRGVKVQARLMGSQGANHDVMFLEKVKVWTDPVRATAA